MLESPLHQTNIVVTQTNELEEIHVEQVDQTSPSQRESEEPEAIVDGIDFDATQRLTGELMSAKKVEYDHRWAQETPQLGLIQDQIGDGQHYATEKNRVEEEDEEESKDDRNLMSA